jgi:cupin fold WbuC family metalloprotein
MKIIDERLLQEMARRASSSPRQRAHYNLHPNLDDGIQRLCIRARRESYFRPHRHPQPGRWELFSALRGSAAVLTFDTSGTVMERIEISGEGPVHVVEIPPGAWHTLSILKEETVLLEVKPGPYLPLHDKDFAAWAPEESSSSAPLMTAKLHQARVGDRPVASSPSHPVRQSPVVAEE